MATAVIEPVKVVDFGAPTPSRRKASLRKRPPITQAQPAFVENGRPARESRAEASPATRATSGVAPVVNIVQGAPSAATGQTRPALVQLPSNLVPTNATVKVHQTGQAPPDFLRNASSRYPRQSSAHSHPPQTQQLVVETIPTSQTTPRKRKPVPQVTPVPLNPTSSHGHKRQASSRDKPLPVVVQQNVPSQRHGVHPNTPHPVQTVTVAGPISTTTKPTRTDRVIYVNSGRQIVIVDERRNKNVPLPLIIASDGTVLSGTPQYQNGTNTIEVRSAPGSSGSRISYVQPNSTADAHAANKHTRAPEAAPSIVTHADAPRSKSNRSLFSSSKAKEQKPKKPSKSNDPNAQNWERNPSDMHGWHLIILGWLTFNREKRRQGRAINAEARKRRKEMRKKRQAEFEAEIERRKHGDKNAMHW